MTEKERRCFWAVYNDLMTRIEKINGVADYLCDLLCEEAGSAVPRGTEHAHLLDTKPPYFPPKSAEHPDQMLLQSILEDKQREPAEHL
jgi:hypothetical protein